MPLLLLCLCWLINPGCAAEDLDTVHHDYKQVDKELNSPAQTHPTGPTGHTPIVCTIEPACSFHCDMAVPHPGTPGYCCDAGERTTCQGGGYYDGGRKDFDADNDGILNIDDNCWLTPNANQTNTDSDDYGDACDKCPDHPSDNQYDMDHDGIGDVCDPDVDGDGVLNAQDLCPLLPNVTVDTDGDGVGDGCDNCPTVANTDQLNTTTSHWGDVCDPDFDLDGDGLLSGVDNCPNHPNPIQRDYDQDGIGNACDSDLDGDGISNEPDPNDPLFVPDNCPHVPNPDQISAGLSIVYGGRQFSAGRACAHKQGLLERVKPFAGAVPAHFNTWTSYIMPPSRKNMTMISRVSTPAPAVTRHLVFMAAGQQSTDGLADYLTGQKTKYSKDFPLSQPNLEVDFSTNSLMKDLLVKTIDDNGFTEPSLLDMGETYAAVAFNAVFDWGSPGLQDARNAFYDYLKGSVDMNRIETITLAGHSRGGCLVAQLARLFRQDYPHIPVMLELYDPVCMYDVFPLTNEFGIPGFAPAYNNPYIRRYFVIGTDIRAELTPHASTGQDVSNLRVLNVSSGQGVMAAHAFTQWNNPSTLTEGTHTWYEHFWTDASHGLAEYEALTSNHGNYNRLGIDFLKKSCTLIDCKL